MHHNNEIRHTIMRLTKLQNEYLEQNIDKEGYICFPVDIFKIDAYKKWKKQKRKEKLCPAQDYKNVCQVTGNCEYCPFYLNGSCKGCKINLKKNEKNKRNSTTGILQSSQG